MLAIFIFKTASWLSYHCPDRLRYALATVAGELYYWIARRHSSYADRNLQIVLGEPKINRRVRLMARRSFRNYAKYMLDFLRQPYLTPKYFHEAAGQVGWPILNEAMAKGKGVLVITPHFGNWDGAAMVVGMTGIKVSTVANDFKPPELNELIQGTRSRYNVKIYSPKDALRGLYTTLKNNGMVALLFDSPVEGDGVVVNFFGRPARFPSGPATIALRTGAELMLGYLARQPGNRTYYGMWEKPLSFETTGDRDKDIEIVTQAIAYTIEGLVRRHPDQWYMFRKLWLDENEIAEYEKRKAEAAAKPRRASRKVAKTESEQVS